MTMNSSGFGVFCLSIAVHVYSKDVDDVQEGHLGDNFPSVLLAFIAEVVAFEPVRESALDRRW